MKLIFQLLIDYILLIYEIIKTIILFFVNMLLWIIKIIIFIFTGKLLETKKTYKKYQTESNNNKKEPKVYDLSEEDIKIAKSERMSYDDYIEAEDFDDDNLDIDHKY